MFYYLPISSRAVARSEVKFAIICEKITKYATDIDNMPRESLYKLSFNSNCLAWPLRLDDVINKLLKRLLVSFKPIVNSLKVMDHFNFDTWRKLDFCSRDTNTCRNRHFLQIYPRLLWRLSYRGLCGSGDQADHSLLHFRGWQEVWTLKPLSRSVAMIYCLGWPWPAATTGKKTVTWSQESGWRPSLVRSRETISGVRSVDTSWRSIKSARGN